MDPKVIGIKTAAQELRERLMRQREEIVLAFAAKYNCDPADMIQEMGRLKNGAMSWRVRLMTEQEKESAHTARVTRELLAESGTALVYAPRSSQLKLWWTIRNFFMLAGFYIPVVYLAAESAKKAAGPNGTVIKVRLRS